MRSLPSPSPLRSVPTIFPPGTEEAPSRETRPPYPPDSLTVDQIRYALSQWFLSLRYGRGAGRRVLEAAAAWIAYHRRHNSEAKLSHTRTTRTTLSRSGIDVNQIRSCLESNFALYW